MLELTLIKSLLKLGTYNKYRDYVKLKPEDKELARLYKVLDHLISTYQRDISIDEYELAVSSEYDDLGEYLSQLKTTEVQEDVLNEVVQKLVHKAKAFDLAMLAIDVNEGRKDFEEILSFYSKFEQKVEVSDVEFVTDDLQEIFDETVHTPGLRWRLKALNQSLGSLRRGDFGFIFARPETGKTTFLASEVTNFALQTDRPILWINNEEAGKKVKTRCYQATLGITTTELFSNIPMWYNKYMDLTNGNIKIFDSASINKRQVEKIVKEMEPALIIFDQIDKIKGFDADRNDLRLGSIYIWARELAKSYCPVIGVCQSDVSGEGKKWLTMDNVAESKTAKQAEADFIIGIGKTHDIGMENVRYLHLSKNKLTGDEDSVPEMRHGRMEVLIKPEIARYLDYT